MFFLEHVVRQNTLFCAGIRVGNYTVKEYSCQQIMMVPRMRLFHKEIIIIIIIIMTV